MTTPITLTDEEIRIRIAEACGFVKHKANEKVDKPVFGMELVCGHCNAVIPCRDKYGWAQHESCGPMGCICYGGDWRLFASVWVRNGKVQSLPDYLNDLNAAMQLVQKVRLDGWVIYIYGCMPDRWRVEFAPAPDMTGEVCTGLHEKLATAICLAFLATIHEPSA